MVVESNGPIVLNNDFGWTSHRGDPTTEIASIRHCCRQTNEPDSRRAHNEHFFPHPTAVGVLKEVDFIQHDDL